MLEFSPCILWGLSSRPTTHLRLYHLQNSFRLETIIRWTQPFGPWWARLYCAYGSSLSIYSIKPPNLTSASTAYIEKAVIENLSDRRPAKSSAIKPLLTLLTPSESLSTSPLPCNLFLFALHEDTWPWFLHIHYNQFHSPLLPPHHPPFNAYSQNMEPFPICTFAHVLLLLLDDDRTYFASLQPLYYSPGKSP